MRVLYVLLTWFLLHVLVVTIDGLNDEIHHADVGVVLGNKVEQDGTPSDRLKSRLEKAVELYRDGYLSYILVSGGIGIEGYDEAKVMKSYLVQKGIPADRIMVDSEGVNTRATAQNSRKMMDAMGLQSVIVITQFYHISRTKLAFHQVGYDSVYSAHADYFEWRDCYSLFREFFAYYKYLFHMSE
ncbi:YdcF family protein [Brevibacillus migulae]|uniref:YdcF family protein n=1 Tax=Brevibacillus migulae TaxID=1644114 RepID=UPI00106DE5F9|nr:YdcF family protein [Brevibacillus migulae]